MKTIRWFAGILFLIAVIALTGCAKDTETADMRVELTRSGNSKIFEEKDLTLVTAINLDIRYCEMHYSEPGNIKGWFTLPCQEGIYNILDISPDASLILVHDTQLPQGTITRFRWILGDQNTIEIAGITYSLKIPSGEESGLKINLKEDIHHDHSINVRLVFDSEDSVVKKQNGEYVLAPVIRVDVITQD